MTRIPASFRKTGGFVSLAVSLLVAGGGGSAPAASSPPASTPSSAQPTASSAAAPTATAGAASAPAAVTLTTAHTGSLSNLPTYIALERGYFAAEGLDIQLEQFR